jgi:glutathione S-transferase
VTLELYHHGSSACAAKVRFALAEKRVPWTSRYIDILAGEQFAAAYRALNPKAVVPTLVHDGAVIVESTVICEYLEDVFHDEPLYPDNPLERAAVRVWTKAVDEELHPACSALTYVVSHRHSILQRGFASFEEFAASAPGDGAAARALKWQWIQHGIAAPGAADKIRLYDAYLHKMDEALRDREWLVGQRFTMADVAMAPYVNRIAALAMEQLWQGGRLPRVEHWFERVRARPTFAPSFTAWLPPHLAAEMRANGERSWLGVAHVLGL